MTRERGRQLWVTLPSPQSLGERDGCGWVGGWVGYSADSADRDKLSVKRAFLVAATHLGVILLYICSLKVLCGDNPLRGVGLTNSLAQHHHLQPQNSEDAHEGCRRGNRRSGLVIFFSFLFFFEL